MTCPRNSARRKSKRHKRNVKIPTPISIEPGVGIFVIVRLIPQHIAAFPQCIAVEFAENYGKTITSILVGNNIVNIASATLGTLLFTSLFKGYGAVVSTIVVTIIVLVFGEILPKNYAKAAPERYAIRFIKSLTLFKTSSEI